MGCGGMEDVGGTGRAWGLYCARGHAICLVLWEKGGAEGGRDDNVRVDGRGGRGGEAGVEGGCRARNAWDDLCDDLGEEGSRLVKGDASGGWAVSNVQLLLREYAVAERWP